MTDDYLVRIGRLIRDARQHRGWTQAQLAEALSTSQSAVNRIERGNQNISLEMIARIGEALDSEIVSLGYSGPMHLRVVGGRRLSGAIDVKTSKNACVALLCATLLNAGRTGPGRDGHRRGPPYPQCDHVPRSAAAPHRPVPHPVRGRLRPGHPYGP